MSKPNPALEMAMNPRPKTALDSVSKPNLKYSPIPISRHQIDQNHQKQFQIMNLVNNNFGASVDSVINVCWVAVRFYLKSG